MNNKKLILIQIHTSHIYFTFILLFLLVVIVVVTTTVVYCGAHILSSAAAEEEASSSSPSIAIVTIIHQHQHIDYAVHANKQLLAALPSAPAAMKP